MRFFFVIIIIALVSLFMPMLPNFCVLDKLISKHQSYYTVIVSLLALLLGVFYFFHRQKYDNNARIAETRRQQLKVLSKQLCIYDSYVEELLNKIPSSEKELLFLRNKISKQSEIINIMLKGYKDILKFSQSDMDSFLELDAYVDKSEVIMRVPYTAYEKESLYQIHDFYIERIKTALKICLKM